MAKRRKAQDKVLRSIAPAPQAPSQAARIATGALLLAAVVFYWVPLTSPEATIQWDAVDVHYSAQRYFSETVRGGRLPHWAPYILSGFPFLSDPQIGAWYPLNWPFFLLGVTPKGIQLQLALHCLIALAGMYRFAREYFERREAAVLAAMAYAFSGYFAGHASHVGMFATAAWLPWLLWSVRRAVLRGSAAWGVVAGSLMGLVALIGHFQNALYAGLAAALYSVALVVRDRSRWRAAAASLAMVMVLGVLLGAVLIVPGLELTGESIRAGMRFTNAADATLTASGLATLVHPNALGAISGEYRGPADVTQHYLYAGVLLVPLALLGLRRRVVLIPALTLVIPAAWYALGPAGGLYLLVARLPGLASVRAPVHAWFVVALGLALLAGAGCAELMRWKSARYLVLGIPLVLFADTCWRNSIENPLAYRRAGFDTAYGGGLRLFENRVARELPELERFYAPYSLQAFGPQNHPLDARTETTYGYNPLELSRYRAYTEAAKSNERLLAGLNVGLRLDMTTGQVAPATSLPRFFFAHGVEAANGPAESLARLATLDPAETAIVEGPLPNNHDPECSVRVVSRDEQSYVVDYRCGGESLLGMAVPYYPGWRAEVDGQPLRVLPMDHALIGVLVPAGDHELQIEFRTGRFTLSAVISLIAALGVLGFLIIRRRDFASLPQRE